MVTVELDTALFPLKKYLEAILGFILFIPIQNHKKMMRPGPQSPPYFSAVVKRWRNFYNSHGAFRCHVEYLSNGKKAQTGWFELVRNTKDKSIGRDSLKIAYHLEDGHRTYSYVHNGNVTLEVWPNQQVYDRLTTPGFFLPEAREYEGSILFPQELAIGAIDRAFFTKNVKVTSIGHGETQYFVTVTTMTGTADKRVVLGSKGEILASEVRRTGTIPWSGYRCFDYSFRPDPSQKFDVRPPLGYYQYGFDHTLDAIQYGKPLPNDYLNSKGAWVPARSVLGAKRTMIVFLDRSMPYGLSSVLATINKSVKVVIFSRHKPDFNVPYPDYIGSSKAFNDFGIGSYPMFYLMKGKFLDQAWVGFDHNQRGKFISQVRTVLGGKHISAP